MVFEQQFLTSGATDEFATTFELLRSGSEACFGPIETGEEGPGQAEAMPIPEVGDARLGVLTTIEEAGGWAEWRLHDAFVLDDEVLMSFLVVDIRAGDGVEPYSSVSQCRSTLAARRHAVQRSSQERGSHHDGPDPASLWADLIASLAVLVVTLVPCIGAVMYGRRASKAGRPGARAPMIIGALAGAALVALTALNL